MKKKISALIFLLAITILSGAMLNRFFKWAENAEGFDFDFNEDIDFIEPPE